MQISSAPAKFLVPFADGDVNKVEIPVTTLDTSRASQTLGFPPLTMLPVEAGGVPPQGEDFNGAMNQVARAAWWSLAGGRYPHDPAFAAASQINGYPKGATVLSADGARALVSRIDNNTSDPANSTPTGNWGPPNNPGLELVAPGAAVTLTDIDAASSYVRVTGAVAAPCIITLPPVGASAALPAFVLEHAGTGSTVTVRNSASTSSLVVSTGQLVAMRQRNDGTLFDALSGAGTVLAPVHGGTGITSLGAGVATWLQTPSSANLAAAVPDETGTGALVFANSPTLVTPVLGTPASGNLSNCTSYPAAALTGTMSPVNGGTGVANNAASTLTLSGAFASTFTITGVTSVTFPTSGTLATTAQLPVGANPTASVGLAAVNGVATTFLRSDGAPALSQSISPTWTGNHNFSPSSGNTLFSAGNVGIGGAPAFRFDVLAGSARVVELLLSNAATPGTLATTPGVYSPASGVLGISANSLERARIGSGGLALQVAGDGLLVKEGSNAKQGLATLVAGTVTVSNTSVTANSRIFLTPQNTSGTAGSVSVTARTVGTDFTIGSTNALDTRDIAYFITEPS